MTLLKLRFLKLCFRAIPAGMRRTEQSPGARLPSGGAAEGDLLDRSRTYCALDETLHKRESATSGSGPTGPRSTGIPIPPPSREFARATGAACSFHKYVQWQIDLQLASSSSTRARSALPVGFYHDLALATDSCGATSGPIVRSFVSGCRVGSPPDDFAPKGQDWAFPPPNSRTPPRERIPALRRDDPQELRATAARCASIT